MSHTALSGSGDRLDLLERSSGGVDVTLVWDRRRQSLSLQIVDRCTERAVELAVPPARATYAFHHPFAYELELAAASRLAA